MKDLVALNLHMIVTIVDGGIGEDVIDLFQSCWSGRRDGPLHGRGSGVHDTGKFLGLDMDQKKISFSTLFLTVSQMK